MQFDKSWNVNNVALDNGMVLCLYRKGSKFNRRKAVKFIFRSQVYC